MAASLPALTNNNNNNITTTTVASNLAHRTDTPPKTLRGLNKPKCQICGNVARSRLILFFYLIPLLPYSCVALKTLEFCNKLVNCYFAFVFICYFVGLIDFWKQFVFGWNKINSRNAKRCCGFWIFNWLYSEIGRSFLGKRIGPWAIYNIVMRLRRIG